MFFNFRQGPRVDDEHVIIHGQRENHLQPSAAGATAHGPKFAAPRPPILAGADDLFAFRRAHAVLGGMGQVPIDPAEDVTFHAANYTHLIGGGQNKLGARGRGGGAGFDSGLAVEPGLGGLGAWRGDVITAVADNLPEEFSLLIHA